MLIRKNTVCSFVNQYERLQIVHILSSSSNEGNPQHLGHLEGGKKNQISGL